MTCPSNHRGIWIHSRFPQNRELSLEVQAEEDGRGSVRKVHRYFRNDALVCSQTPKVDGEQVSPLPTTPLLGSLGPATLGHELPTS